MDQPAPRVFMSQLAMGSMGSMFKNISSILNVQEKIDTDGLQLGLELDTIRI